MLTAAGKAVQRNVAGRAVQRNVAATRMTPVSLKGPAQGGKGLTLFEKWGASPASIAKRQEAGAVQAQQKLAQQVAAGLSAPDKEVALVLDELICVLEENEEIKLHRQLDSELGDSDFSLVDHYNPSKRTRITSRPLVDYYRGSMAEVASGRWSLAEADRQKLARKAAVAELRASQLSPLKKQKVAGSGYSKKMLKPGGALHVTCSTPPVFTNGIRKESGKLKKIKNNWMIFVSSSKIRDFCVLKN